MNIQELFLRAEGHEHSGELREAADLYDKCLEIDPLAPAVHFKLALCLLQLGEYERGWLEYEWRFAAGLAQRIVSPRPAWTGEDLAGKSIFVLAQQGIGDTLQLIRYASLLRCRGVRVLLGCKAELKSILSGCSGIDAIVPRGSVMPDFDFYCHLESLPYIFGTTINTIPSDMQYLRANVDDVSKWAAELAAVPGKTVGVCWQGDPSYEYDNNRSFPLSAFAPIANHTFISLVSLQKEHGVEQLADCPFPIVDLSERLDALAPFSDTSAIMQNLDLVISCDSAVAHLAGALGVPVWVPLPKVHDWRWIAGRDDSPWYPTMRLFRQEKIGEWGPVFERMANELRALVKER